MAYIVVKTIKGREYRYQQRSYRLGSKVRTETVYLGPVDGVTRSKGALRRVNEVVVPDRPRRYGLPDDDVMLKQYNDKVERERQERAVFLADLHDRYGLRVDDGQPGRPEHEKAPSEEGAAVNTQTPAST